MAKTLPEPPNHHSISCHHSLSCHSCPSYPFIHHTPIHPLPLNQSSQQATTPAPSGAGVVSIICSHVGV
ncbi:MAG: hypothetical protein IJD12_06475 [Tidjanibacter sp.]|nr:hypothetical protein [Tidjanibacter sp.]